MKYVLLWVALAVGVTNGAWGQSFCASDGRATPLLLVEHFISADCAACWSAPQATPPAARAMTIDWIVPSAQGDEAPLSAAAVGDAKTRLDSLGQSVPATSIITTTQVLGGSAYQLQVAHGLSVGAYVGATIELTTSVEAQPSKPLAAWLLLVETLPAGVEGAQSEKNLVRNVLVSTWDRPDEQTSTGQSIYRELRPLSIAQSARPQRLRVMGWVQDASGQVLSAAQSVCSTPIELD
jgi:hypothetical protein